MIFDRTQEDIEKAYELRSKLQNGDSLTESEIALLERGTLTINTLNRIEEKIIQLKPLLDEMDYRSKSISSRIWDYEDYFKQSDFERILQNIFNLRTASILYEDTPPVPENNYRKYSVINDVERILYDLEEIINEILSNYRECGNTECGEG
jgi:hypothetical protein